MLICSELSDSTPNSISSPEKEANFWIFFGGKKARGLRLVADSFGLSSRLSGSSAMKFKRKHNSSQMHLRGHRSKRWRLLERSLSEIGPPPRAELSSRNSKCHTYTWIRWREACSHVTGGEMMKVQWVTHCTSHATILNEFWKGFFFSFITT